MSHFRIMVIGENVEEQLEPFGEDYRQETHQLKEWHSLYERDTTTGVVSPDGKQYHWFDDRFWKQLDKNERKKYSLTRGCDVVCDGRKDDGTVVMNNKKFVLPEGWTEQKGVPISQVMTFQYYMVHYNEFAQITEESYNNLDKDDIDFQRDYVIVNEKGEIIDVIVWCNPNAKWDWYQIGGRFENSLKLKDNSQANIIVEGKYLDEQTISAPINQTWVVVKDDDTITKNTSSLQQGDLIKYEEEIHEVIRVEPYAVDSARKGDIDFEGMLENDINKFANKYDSVHKVIDHFITEPYVSWSTLIENVNIEDEKIMDSLREKYNSQPIVKAFNKLTDNDIFSSVNDYLCSREQFIENRKYNSWRPYAIVKNGEWITWGKMLWFGLSEEDMSAQEWNSKVTEILNQTADDEWITIVDVHAS